MVEPKVFLMCIRFYNRLTHRFQQPATKRKHGTVSNDPVNSAPKDPENMAEPKVISSACIQPDNALTLLPVSKKETEVYRSWQQPR